MEKLDLGIKLPTYLENDLDNYIKAVNEKSTLWDCWYNEVQSSLRMAYGDGKITKEQLEAIKDHYL